MVQHGPDLPDLAAEWNGSESYGIRVSRVSTNWWSLWAQHQWPSSHRLLWKEIPRTSSNSSNLVDASLVTYATYGNFKFASTIIIYHPLLLKISPKSFTHSWDCTEHIVWKHRPNMAKLCHVPLRVDRSCLGALSIFAMSLIRICLHNEYSQ